MGQEASKESSDFWEPYHAHATTLRSWVIAYGIAVPYLFISQKDFAAVLQPYPYTRFTILLFLGGVCLQLLQLLWSKYLMMALYHGEVVPAFKSSWVYKVCDKHSERFWPFIVTDLGTLLAYAVGTAMLFNAVLRIRTDVLITNPAPQAGALVSSESSPEKSGYSAKSDEGASVSVSPKNTGALSVTCCCPQADHLEGPVQKRANKAFKPTGHKKRCPAA